jgi:hypothetical protein
MLNYLNGIEDNSEMGAKFKPFKKVVQTIKGKADKIKLRSDEIKGRKGLLKRRPGKKIFKKVAKVGLAPGRAAFLLAVSQNYLKLAKRLKQAYAKNPARIKQFWSNYGGDWNKLQAAIQRGSGSRLGIDPATVTMFAAAVPLIIAIVKIFRDLRSDKPGDDVDDNPGIDAGKDALDNDPNFDKGNAEMDPGQETGKIPGGVSGETAEFTQPGGDTTGMGIFDNKILLYGALGVGAILLLTRKK